MSITDELREWFKDRMFMANGWQEIHDIADRIDAEHEAACAEAYGDGVMSVPIALDESQWVKLPVDADGVPIRVGDVLDGYGKAIEVVEMRHGRSGWVLISRDGNGYVDTFAFTHHHEPTVEDLLREFALACEDAGNSRPAVMRLAEEYASRLRLAGDE